MTPDVHNHALRFRRFQQSRENFYAPKINAELLAQYQSVTRLVESLGIYAVNEIDSSGIATLLKKIYIDAATVYGAKARADLVKQGIRVTLDKVPLVRKDLKARGAIGFSERMQRLVNAYFKTDIFNTAEKITEITRKLIVKTITEAYAEGISIPEIVKKLEGPDVSKKRARVIARTETVGAANWAALEVARASGLMMNKTWLATRDKRTRDDHVHINGNQVAMEDFFIVGGYSMMVPGDKGGHNGQPEVDPSEYVNCRCTCTYQAIRDAQGRLIRV